MIFGVIMLSLGFVPWILDDHYIPEARLLGSRYAKKMMLVGAVNLIIGIALHYFSQRVAAWCLLFCLADISRII